MAALEPSYRNDLERNVGAQLAKAGISPNYETRVIEYEVPARKAKYRPDFPIGNIIIETKGYFGGTGRFIGRKWVGGSGDQSVKQRQKMVLIKEQHPELDIRFVFEKPNTKIRKGSPTTYARWAEDHGFKWAKGTVPDAWITDLLAEQRKVNDDCTTLETQRASRPRPSRKAGKH